jgi:hypothetical protein
VLILVHGGKHGTGLAEHGKIMRIDELVNPEKFNVEEYDLQDDLIFFMNNDPDFYRRHYYPSIIKMKLHHDRGQELDSSSLSPIVKHAYSAYKEKFPVKNLDKDLEKSAIDDICSKILETEMENFKTKQYDEK